MKILKQAAAYIIGMCVLASSEMAYAQEKMLSSIHVITLDSSKIAWITLTEKLEVVIAFKEPMDDLHSVLWNKARDLEAALKVIELVQKSQVQSLEINTKDALSLGGTQRCKVRCEIVGFRFSPPREGR